MKTFLAEIDGWCIFTEMTEYGIKKSVMQSRIVTDA
jgi:hypothetical protein